MLVMIVTLPHAGRQHGAHALRQQRVVALLRVALPAQLRQRDRALGQALEHQRIESAALGQVLRRIDPVAGVAGAGSRCEMDSCLIIHPGRLHPSGRGHAGDSMGRGLQGFAPDEPCGSPMATGTAVVAPDLHPASYKTRGPAAENEFRAGRGSWPNLAG